MARKIVIALTAGLLTLSVAACNTVRGVGQDLESLADDAAEAI